MGHELPKFRLVIRARGRPSHTYTYVVTRNDNLDWSEVGAGRYKTVDEAAEAGRLAINRLETSHPLVQS
jgi:hypothetical protein